MTRHVLQLDPFRDDPVVGEYGFLARLSGEKQDGMLFKKTPCRTNDSDEVRMEGFCGSWNNVATIARGVGRVSRVTGKTYHVIELRGEDERDALVALGYEDLAEERCAA